MEENKITVTLDEVNSSQVDDEIKRQSIAGRMAEHQEMIRQSSGEMLGAKGGFFRKSIVYMTLFGLIFSILGWGFGEGVYKKIEQFDVFLKVSDLIEEKMLEDAKEYNLYRSGEEFHKAVNERIVKAGEELPELKGNPYFRAEFVQPFMKDEESVKSGIVREVQAQKRNGVLWHVLLSSLIAVGLSIAESCVSCNWQSALKNGLAGLLLGALGGLVMSWGANFIYLTLGGGQQGEMNFTQVFARAVAWGVLGMFTAVAPGLVMRSKKKILLGCLGGLIGGMLGGALFDVISKAAESAVLSRFVNIVGLGVGAAVAMVLLEQAAKRGWLRVLSGVITGKQFILYRNPTVIGSSPKCEIYLFKDTSVLPQHASINQREGDFYITAIGGQPVILNETVTQQSKLRSGDKIRIGQTMMVFEAKEVAKG